MDIVSHLSSAPLSSAPNETQSLLTSSQTAYLRGWRLSVIRVVWGCLALIILSTFAYTLYHLYHLTLQHASSAFGDSLTQANLSTEFIAWFYVVRRILGFGVILVVAGLIFWQRSDNLLAAGVSIGMLATSLNVLRVHVEIDYTASLEIPLMMVIFASITAMLGMMFIVGVFFVMPDGKFTPTWTRWVFAAWVALLPAAMLFITRPQLPAVINVVVFPFILVGIYSQIYRYRRLTQEADRRRTEWVMIGMLIASGGFIVFLLMTRWFFPEVHLPSGARLAYQLIGISAWHITVLAVPVCVGIALLRHQLWDVKIILNRSVVYVVVSVALLGVLLIAVTVIEWGLEHFVGERLSTAAIIGSTFAIALLFFPARNRLQGWIERYLPLTPAPSSAPSHTVKLPTPTVTLAATESPEGSQMWGNYQIIGLIGRGGMAEVFHAYQCGLNREVAIKVLLPNAQLDAEAYRRFAREGQLAANLRHPHIVQVYDYGVQGNQPYLVMEYISGFDLAQYLKTYGRLTLSQTTTIIGQIAAALDYAHQRGMVHRDVKPSNILLRQHDPHAMTHAHGYQAVLADFGIAKSLHANTQLTATGIVGTLDYLAPEQIVKPREVDHRVDIYALGVVAYQLLTGRLPFQTDNYGALLYAHLHEPPLDPRNLIAGLADEFVCAMLRALAKHPDERYATAGAFAQALMTTTPNINIKP